MRPTYESAQNRADEQEVAGVLERWAKCTLEKLSMREYIDWKAHRDGKLVALIEFKRRKNPRLQYPTYMISHAKWLNGLRMSRESGVPFILTVRWTDGLFYLNVSDTVPITLAQGGRYDRGDALDVEQMAYIDTALFKHIATM